MTFSSFKVIFRKIKYTLVIIKYLKYIFITSRFINLDGMNSEDIFQINFTDRGFHSQTIKYIYIYITKLNI